MTERGGSTGNISELYSRRVWLSARTPVILIEGFRDFIQFLQAKIGI
jgi:hypothetical protein